MEQIGGMIFRVTDKVFQYCKRQSPMKIFANIEGDLRGILLGLGGGTRFRRHQISEVEQLAHEVEEFLFRSSLRETISPLWCVRPEFGQESFQTIEGND